MLPPTVARGVATAVGWAAAEAGRRGLSGWCAERRFVVARNLRRIGGAPLEAAPVEPVGSAEPVGGAVPAEPVGAPLEGARLERAVRATFTSYARYYAESFRLPTCARSHIDDGHDVVGYEHVVDARRRGGGVILALPHLGGWEWSAFWLTRVVGVSVTAVVEPLHPPELFEWFVAFRRSLGMTIVPLGPHAAREVLAALKRNDVVCLLADRDLHGGGIEVELFGERTTLPAGPATLALRAGVPILPTAVYFKAGGQGVRGVVLPSLDMTRQASLRADVARVTQDLASALERLIRAAPEQWHLMQPNWASDRRALDAWLSAQSRAATEPPTRSLSGACPGPPSEAG